MLRIISVTTSLSYGGAEHHAICFMNRLAERGHECHTVYIKNAADQLERIRLRGNGTQPAISMRAPWPISPLISPSSGLRPSSPRILTR